MWHYGGVMGRTDLHGVGWNQRQVGHERGKADGLPHRLHKTGPGVLGNVVGDVCVVADDLQAWGQATQSIFHGRQYAAKGAKKRADQGDCKQLGIQDGCKDEQAGRGDVNDVRPVPQEPPEYPDRQAQGQQQGRRAVERQAETQHVHDLHRVSRRIRMHPLHPRPMVVRCSTGIARGGGTVTLAP